MPYLGNTAGNRFVASKAATQFSGDGSTTAFTLDHAVGSDEDILVSVDGVIQEPSVAYAVSNGTTLTFTGAPSNNSGNNIFVYYLFRTVGTVDHPSTSALSATSGTFSGAITGGGTFTPGGNIVIPDAGNIGSASDTDAMSISSGGVVTQSAKPSFFAHGTTGTWQSVSSGGIVTELDSTDHNIGSCYDTSNGKFTVPVTGVYCFQFNLYIKQTSNSASWSIYHNGSEFAESGFPIIRVFRNDGDANDETIGCTWTYKYTANDYIEIRASGSTSEYVPYRSYFSGFMVG